MIPSLFFRSSVGSRPTASVCFTCAALITLATLSACATGVVSSTETAQAEKEPSFKWVCRTEVATGMLVATRQCRKVEEMPDEARKARELLESTRVGPIREL